MANDRPLTVCEEQSSCRLSWKLRWHFVLFPVGERAPNVDVVLVVWTDVIDPSNIRRFIFVERSVEPKSYEIQAAVTALCRIVTHRVLLKQRQHGRIHTNPKWIQRL